MSGIVRKDEAEKEDQERSEIIRRWAFTWDKSRQEWIKYKVAWEKKMLVKVGTYNTKKNKVKETDNADYVTGGMRPLI